MYQTMQRWTVHLEGGPRRVNHAAVAIGDKIYSFGGYCTGEDYETTRPMDIHVLDTSDYFFPLIFQAECGIYRLINWKAIMLSYIINEFIEKFST